MKIGIYGGSFNPIHRGHTALASSLVRQGLVDELWFLVSPQNPLKRSLSPTLPKGQGVFPTYEDRVEMARLATRDIHGVQVSDFESHLPIPSYTINTLHALRKAYPQHQFSLVIGEDNWQRFGQWYKADEIIRDYQILVFRRKGEPTPKPSRRDGLKKAEKKKSSSFGEDLGEAPLFVKAKLYDISSTEIREKIKKGKSIRGLVNSRVEKYILERGFYL